MSIEYTNPKSYSSVGESRWLGVFTVDMPTDELFWRDPTKRARVAKGIGASPLVTRVVEHHEIEDEDVVYAVSIPKANFNEATQLAAVQLATCVLEGLETAGIPVEDLRVKGASIVSCTSEPKLPDNPLDVLDLANPLEVSIMTDDYYMVRDMHALEHDAFANVGGIEDLFSL